MYQRRGEKQELYGPEPDFIFNFFFPTEKRPQKYKKDFRHPKGGTGGLPFLRSYSTSKQRKKQYPKVGNSGQQHLKFCQKEI